MRSRNDTQMSAVVNAEVKPTNAYAADVILVRRVSTVAERSCADMAPLSALPVFQKRQRMALRIRSIMKNSIKPPARGIVNSADEYMYYFLAWKVYLYYTNTEKPKHRDTNIINFY
jgi:hypothetical protein